jgi:acetolactate synthase-1/2/3 large subunit
MDKSTGTRGSDLVARTLQDRSVGYVFTLSGNHIMPVFDALLETDIRLIHTRHEAACVHMADAWGRLTGEAGIALVTGGQGHSNAAAALYTALMAESPLVLLSGHAARNELGRGAFQEMAQADLARPVTKASWTAESAETLGADIARAIAIAKAGRPGPVHVSLPVDLLEQATAENSTSPTPPPEAQPLAPETARSVLALIQDAAKPLLVCGPALCNRAGRSLLRETADKIGVPVIAMESPRGVNDPGLGALAEVLAQADLVVLIGKPLDFTLKFGAAPTFMPACKWIVIDPDRALLVRAETALGERLVLSAVADAKSALASLIEAGQQPNAGAMEWRAQAEQALHYVPPQWASLRASKGGYLHSAEMCEVIGEFFRAHPGATFVSDGGEIGQWAQAIVNAENRLINGVAGTIGAAIPFAIAAKLVRARSPVVAVMGDGTFGFHMAEFDTAVRYNIPFIAVVGNDARWNAEYQIQLRQYGEARARHCELLPSHYERVVEALGGFGARVTSAADLRDALERAYRSGKPACVNVMIEGAPAPNIRR